MLATIPVSFRLALAVLLSASSAIAHAIGSERFVKVDQADGVVVAAKGSAATIVLGKDEHEGVLRAARDLQRDIGSVTGATPKSVTGNAPAEQDLIIAGTLGRNPLIDQLARQGKLDVAKLAGQWEGFVIQAVRDPVPGVKRALVIAGSDKRGTIYGIYTLSEQIGVSPWYWWADVPVQKHAVLSVPLATRIFEKPTVQYRGIFLNDEAPALTNWAKQHFGGFNHAFYERLFELMLRMRANYLWPAMWYSSFYDDDKDNGPLADRMGIIMGTSHHEPMMRSQQEWHRHGKGPWDYQHNRDTLRDFWAGGLRNTRDQEKVITMAMRGDGDEPMSENANVELLQNIVSDQRALIRQELGKEPQQVPQLWALYKEVQDYYEKGMRVPDDMLLLWCDDNWGNIRRLPTAEERKRSGGAGVYYHFDYVGVPRSYKWLNVTQIGKVWEQMNLANEYGANRLWVVNVGDLKPMEVPTEFFLAYAWNPAAWPAKRLPQYLRQWAEREFGADHAADIASIVDRYTRYNARRRPEQLEPDTFSLTNYNEAERVVADYNALGAQASRIGQQLPPAARDAYFQLVEYPVLASANALDMYVSTGFNRLYAKQGRLSTNDTAARVRSLFARDAELTKRYQQEISGGKWNHMMSQTRFGYANWDQPYRDIMPAVSELRVPEGNQLAEPNGIHPFDLMGVAVEGDPVAVPVFPIHKLALPALDSVEKKARFIEVFSRGGPAFDYSIVASHPWLRVSQPGGSISKEQRIWIDVDWQAAPAGTTQAELTVKGPGKASVVIKVPVHNRPAAELATVRGHIETGGVVAIEAEHYSRAHVAQDRKWLTIPGYGRTLSGVTTMPALAPALSVQDGMRLEYDVQMVSSGALKIEAVLGPTLKFQPGQGFRYAVAIDDEAPQIVNVHADASEDYWRKLVSDGVAKFVTTHRIDRPGQHTVKFWALDPGLVLQRVVVDAGGLKPSYLGPQESPYR